jgi:hypothetical protein
MMVLAVAGFLIPLPAHLLKDQCIFKQSALYCYYYAFCLAMYLALHVFHIHADRRDHGRKTTAMTSS